MLSLLLPSAMLPHPWLTLMLHWLSSLLRFLTNWLLLPRMLPLSWMSWQTTRFLMLRRRMMLPHPGNPLLQPLSLLTLMQTMQPLSVMQLRLTRFSQRQSGKTMQQMPSLQLPLQKLQPRLMNQMPPVRLHQRQKHS